MIGVLLVNLGTPDGPDTKSVRRYLRQFLSDPLVIDINRVARWFLVNCFIALFRAPKSAAAYQKIWTGEGSPLLLNTLKFAEKVQRQLVKSVHSHAGLEGEVGRLDDAGIASEAMIVEVAMRYGHPSIERGLSSLTEHGVEGIKVLPLYPQYSFSATESSIREVRRLAQKMGGIAPLEFLPPFYDHPGFVKAVGERGRPVLKETDPDHILFSFHGLPERHVKKGDPYRTQCYQTAHAVAGELGLDKKEYSVSFQSRLGRTRWIQPYTDRTLASLPAKGKKNVVVFCPSFVADCLETLEEIGIRGRESFLQNGGERLTVVPCLNDHPLWVDAVCAMIRSSNHAQNQ